VESVPRRRFQEATFDRGNARGTESLQTPRWREVDSNSPSPVRASSSLPPLEEVGFEPLVPRFAEQRVEHHACSFGAKAATVQRDFFSASNHSTEPG
jgi:hypothetical protein